MQKEFQNITKGNKIYTVQLIKAFDAKGSPFSAFIIFDKTDFDKLSVDEPINLTQYKENVIFMKSGHSITQQDEHDVRELLSKYYLKEVNRLT
jgi:predicted proteasome-type protease